MQDRSFKQQGRDGSQKKLLQEQTYIRGGECITVRYQNINNIFFSSNIQQSIIKHPYNSPSLSLQPPAQDKIPITTLTMHFSTIALTSLLSLASAAPAVLDARMPKGNTLAPSAISIYHGSNGAIDYGVARGEVSRNNWDGRDNSTLVTFNLNGQTLPNTCFLRFWLEPGTQSSNPASGSFWSGTGLIDVFSSLQPAPVEGSKGWGGPGNQRNNPLGRMKVNYNGDATVLDFAPNQLSGFKCPQIGDWNVKNGLVGFELVPVGDQDRVQWDGAVSGLYLNW